MPTATLCPTQHWKSFIKITRKPWESSFRSCPTTLPVGGNHNSKQWDGQRWKRDENPARERFHRDFIITWQVRQTLATYPSKSPASILSSTSAQMRLTTRRSTQRQQVCLHASAGSASALVFYSWKWIASDVSSHQLVFRSLGKSSFIFIYLTPPPPALPTPLPLFSSFHARSGKGPVVHPEDSQSPGDDSCGCGVLPCSAAASQRGLQAGQAENGRDERGAVTQPWRRHKNDNIYRVR